MEAAEEEAAGWGTCTALIALGSAALFAAVFAIASAVAKTLFEEPPAEPCQGGTLPCPTSRSRKLKARLGLRRRS